MKKFINLYTILGASFLGLFILLIILLNFDKSLIVDGGKEVGLSHINNWVSYKENKNIDLLTDVFFYTSFSILVFEAILGLIQLIKEKSLFKVDKEIIAFGVASALALAVWLFFDHVFKLNYRPLNPEECSFPSTHAFLVTFFTLSFHGFVCLKSSKNLYKYLSLFISVMFISFVTIGRVAAGKHYITDVCGGLFIGLAFYFMLFGIIKALNNKEEIEE